MKSRLTPVCIALITGLFASARAADRILSTSGAKSGFVAHLGCGDGKLTAMLGASRRLRGPGTDEESFGGRRLSVYGVG